MKKNKTPPSIDTELILKQMTDWAFHCGDILNQHLIDSYKKPLKILDKGKQGLATEADLLSEAYVMTEIQKHYPDHRIISEEDSFHHPTKSGISDDEHLWLIDPLDGTNNFYNRIPLFCVSLAFLKGREPLVGVVYNPVSCELFVARKGKGAHLVRIIGDQEVSVDLKASRQKKDFKEALLSANLTSKRVEKDLLKSFPEVRAMRRLGSAALELSYVAAGMLDAYWEYRLKPWDMGAAALICQEAGVNISNLNGETFDVFEPTVLASHPALYQELTAILNK